MLRRASRDSPSEADDSQARRNVVTLLASLVGTSQRVRDTSSRLSKVRELAAFLRTLSADEVEIAVQYLSGETPQGRSGIGYSALRAASEATTAASTASLSILHSDRALSDIALISGSGAAARRAQA